MRELHISLLREKFIIRDPKVKEDDDGASVIALSNRIVMEFEDDLGQINETFIVRAQNMHSCIRMCSKMIQAYQFRGDLMIRQPFFDWEAAWGGIMNDYEKAYNEEAWGAVYQKGKIIFEFGPRHTLLDLIEKCDAENESEYEESIALAENVFKQTGKVVNIEYDGNVALVVNLEEQEGRIAVILRGADRTTTFNYSVASEEADKPLNFPQCLNASAAFLEGIQMSFMVGMGNEKIKRGIIQRHTKEDKQNKESKQRLSMLNAEISSLEANFKVNYRPERPDFQNIIIDAEKMAVDILDQ